MSIDLAWDALLQSSLSSSLVELINRHLASTPRPSFIGPVTINSFDFGTAPPDVEVVDIRDIYRDFLEDDEDEHSPVLQQMKKDEDLEGFEWISRKTAGMGLAEEAPAYHHLPPHVRYGRGPASDPFSGNPVPPLEMWQGAIGVPNLFQASPIPPPLFRNSPTPAPENDHPNIQLHLRITHQSNLRLTLTTSLLINYPSPSFMSLPMKLSVTGLIFTGEVVVAYEGARSRVHICILDDLDPYGPAGDRTNRQSTHSDDTIPESGSPHPSGKPLPVGLRLLPSIFIESEIGQADKHVLKNGTRVEKFIQDVIRKTVEEELLFPNYHTIILKES
ncbi:hypothetical protein BU17DRAFT_49647 [Hysterangium stoloniferum]|nr:hypothetical protein BU17DRAFT_49647 [Hysterangium stoloniferum]